MRVVMHSSHLAHRPECSGVSDWTDWITTSEDLEVETIPVEMVMTLSIDSFC